MLGYYSYPMEMLNYAFALVLLLPWQVCFLAKT